MNMCLRTFPFHRNLRPIHDRCISIWFNGTTLPMSLARQLPKNSVCRARTMDFFRGSLLQSTVSHSLQSYSPQASSRLKWCLVKPFQYPILGSIGLIQIPTSRLKFQLPKTNGSHHLIVCSVQNSVYFI